MFLEKTMNNKQKEAGDSRYFKNEYQLPLQETKPWI